jgi:hypothetical protein
MFTQLNALLGFNRTMTILGIPQVKAFLNGIKVPGILRFSTFVAKVVGITLCVTAGMPAGREGPMVQAGAIIASGFARGSSKFFHFLPTIYSGFDNPRDRRDFVSMGAAAGESLADREFLIQCHLIVPIYQVLRPLLMHQLVAYFFHSKKFRHFGRFR